MDKKASQEELDSDCLDDEAMLMRRFLRVVEACLESCFAADCKSLVTIALAEPCIDAVFSGEEMQRSLVNEVDAAFTVRKAVKTTTAEPILWSNLPPISSYWR